MESSYMESPKMEGSNLESQQVNGQQVNKSSQGFQKLGDTPLTLGQPPLMLGEGDQPHILNLEVKFGFLNIADCFGHNFCYTTPIDVIQKPMERRLQDLQFICFNNFILRSLRGSKSGCKVKVVICQILVSNQVQISIINMFPLLKNLFR